METEQTKQLEQRALSIPEDARNLTVIDDESFQRGGRILLVIKDLRFKINESFDPIITKAYAAHKEAVSQKKKIEAPLVEAEGIIKPRLASYHDEQERKRREVEEKLRQEAIRKAEEEQLADAVSADQSGMKELSDAILDGPAYVPTVVAPKSTVVVPGVSFRDQWKAEVFDLKALLRAVLESKVPLNVIVPDMTVLNGLARNLKGQLNYPGVRTLCEKITAGGRR